MTDFANRVPAAPRPDLKQRRTLKGHLGKVMSLAWSTDSKQLVSVGQDGKLFLWDPESTNKMQVVGMQSSWAMTCAISPSGKFVATGGLDNICSVYDLKAADAAMSHSTTGTIPATKSLEAHVGFVSGIKFMNDNELLTSSGDHTCGQWDLGRGLLTRQFSGHSADVMGLAMLDGPTFVSCSGDKTARVWDCRTGGCEAMFTTGEDKTDLITIDAFPDRHAFVTGGEDGRVRLFDLRSQQQLQSYIPASQEAIGNPEQRKTVTSVAFTHSGRAIVAGYEDEYMRLWDTFKGTEITFVKAHDERVTCVCMSPDGYGLATGSWDKIIKIWA